MSQIPIPASSSFIDLDKTVLNQKLRRLRSDNVTEQQTSQVQTDHDPPDEDNEALLSPNDMEDMSDELPCLEMDDIGEAIGGWDEDLEVNPDTLIDSNEASTDFETVTNESDSDLDSDPENYEELSETSSISESDFTPIEFDHMQEVIESEIRMNNLRILITCCTH